MTREFEIKTVGTGNNFAQRMGITNKKWDEIVEMRRRCWNHAVDTPECVEEMSKEAKSLNELVTMAYLTGAYFGVTTTKRKILDYVREEL